MFNKILVAVDMEGAKAELVESAIALAKATNAQLKLVNVLTAEDDDSMPLFAHPGLTGYPPVLDDSIWQGYRERYQDYQEAALIKLRRLANQASAAGVRAEFNQESGGPGRAICDLAASWEADLVMVGNRGRKGLSELFLGSVSNYVMHHAPCSVLVHHAHQEDRLTTELAAETFTTA